jgi:hypothetical protein
MKYIGVPRYISSGAHTRGKETFRFMVMERFGSDVQKIFEKAGKKFSRHTVCALALRLVNMICKNTVSYTKITLSSLTPPYLCACLKTGSEFTTSYIMLLSFFIFSELLICHRDTCSNLI